jgi:hypothetical protein
MNKWMTFILAAGMCVGVFSLGRASEEPAKKEEAAPAKTEEPLIVPPKTLEAAKVLDWQELQKFLPKAPEGWTTAKPRGMVHRIGPHAVSQVRQTFQKGAQRIDVILEDLGSNNPYMFMKEPWKPYEGKTEGSVARKIMLAKVPAEEHVREKEMRCLVFLVFEKRIQLNVSGSGMADAAVLVDMAKQIDFLELKKSLEEKSK